MWLTTDGGHTWTQHGTDSTDALEVTDGKVLRVTHPGIFGCPGCVYSVQTAPVGSTTWHSLGSPTSVVGDSAILAVAGTDLYVGAIGHTAGGAEDAHTQFARSSDLGTHWSTFVDPCTVTPSGDEADASAIAAAPGGYLVVACTPRVPNEAAFIVVSADAGATFGPHRFGLLTTVSPGGEFATAVAAATGQRMAVLVSGNGTFSIAVTNDAGIDWTVTHSEPIPGTNAGANFLGFEDATTGRAVVAAGTDADDHRTAAATGPVSRSRSLGCPTPPAEAAFAVGSPLAAAGQLWRSTVPWPWAAPHRLGKAKSSPVGRHMFDRQRPGGRGPAAPVGSRLGGLLTVALHRSAAVGTRYTAMGSQAGCRKIGLDLHPRARRPIPAPSHRLQVGSNLWS